MSRGHYVICVQCGKQFDANNGAAYDPQTRRYTCRRCVSRNKADRRKARTGMRQSTGAMIAKLVFGFLFVIAGFSSPEGGWTIGYFLTALALGGGLIAWGLVPWLKAKRQKSQPCGMDAPKEMRTCPSCGGIGTGSYCEYCGKPFSQ